MLCCVLQPVPAAKLRQSPPVVRNLAQQLTPQPTSSSNGPAPLAAVTTTTKPTLATAAAGVDIRGGRPLVTTQTAEPKEVLGPNDAAFVTIFYDFGEDSDDLLLATRVLMRSIHDSKTRFRKIVIVPEDGIREESAALLQRDGHDVELLQVDIPNVFLHARVIDHRAQLSHMRNKLVLWDDPVLSSLQRVVYLDPENLVMRNLDEIFACKHFCAVDNGQSIVYANSLLVVSPSNHAARSLYSDAVDAFWISGRAYNWVGITQGFLPGLFEAFEESPLFYQDEEEERDAVGTDDDDSTGFVDDRADSVVRRLPFYYSINHMVFYERLNWDLYKCKDKNAPSDGIPGPLLSFKYSGSMIKPWFWVPYVYFQVFWHWQAVRDRLDEDHSSAFISKITSLSVIFAFTWWAYIILCLKLHNEPNGRIRRLSSWGLPAPSNAPTLSLDIFNSRIVRRACQFSCNLLLAVSSMPVLSSMVIVWLVFLLSVYLVPATMHPRSAAFVWLYLQNLLMTTVLLVYKIAHIFRTVQWKRNEIPTSPSLLWLGLLRCIKRIPLFIALQLLFLYSVGRTDWFRNPVLRPVALIGQMVIIACIQVRVLSQEMRNTLHK
ncbi:TPA: hypothetical protein N0F65_003120 [Lagenidium giganteum]|uniref:Nucleotide-diphospho-sugar transferase n=1 Tax=Lagenidium giganteum TaxID=4803 RepID=A0AAV2YXW3_9STRA|nr:TPA: hypothetical protein N0F65_003120 [Lagenidium giganteum]